MEDPAAVAVLAVAPGELLALVCQLRAEVTQLRQEVSRLQRENVELRRQANYWRAHHARAVERIQELEQQVGDLQAENRQLRQQAFGPKTERVKRRAADGLSAVADPPAERRRRGQRSDQPGPQRRGYEHLPARTQVIELPLAQRGCPQCGQPYAERPETEDSEQIEIEVQAYRRVIRRKRYQPRAAWKTVRHERGGLPLEGVDFLLGQPQLGAARFAHVARLARELKG